MSVMTNAALNQMVCYCSRFLLSVYVVAWLPISQFPSLHRSLSSPPKAQPAKQKRFIYHDMWQYYSITWLTDLSPLDLSHSELMMMFNKFDLKRLELYSRNMADHHLITDLLPARESVDHHLHVTHCWLLSRLMLAIYVALCCQWSTVWLMLTHAS